MIENNLSIKDGYKIIDTIRGLWAGHALLAAHELGVLALLWQDDCSFDQITQQLSLDPRGTCALLSTLHNLGIVEQNGETYALTAIGRQAADPDGAYTGYLGFHALLRRSWADLPVRLRQGDSSGFAPNHTDSPELVAQYIKAMDALGTPIAHELAAILNVKPGEKVLDLGGGSGVYARAILARQPEAKIVFVDRPVVVQMLRNSLMANSTALHGLQLVEGDYFTFDGNGQFDIVLLANVIHNENAEDNVRILHTCANALRPGGHLAILDYLATSPTDDSTAPLGFEMLIYLITRDGQVHSRDTLILISTQAGFETPNVIQLGRYCLAICRIKGGGI
jgi:SAM-dependent methyltransferase